MPRTRPRLVTVALLIGAFLAAMDLNVVGTSLPTVVGQLGGLRLYGLVFSVYLLTSTTTIPLYGRLADLYGRKPVYLAAAGLFLLGSALCGAAPSMIGLILCRGVQGLGAGGLIPVTITLFGDLFPAERRALVQGLFSTVWGVSSVLGPLVGGFIVTFVSWRWIFWINLPAGLLAIALLVPSLHETLERATPRPRLDLGGAVLLLGSLTLLILGLQGIEGAAGWSLPGALLTLALLLAVLFLRRERRIPHPLLPLDLFRNRALWVTSLGGLSLGGVLFSLVTFVPLFVQGVEHGSPTRAGLALVPLSLAWTATTFLAGRAIRSLGYRGAVILGSLLIGIGALLMGWIPASPAAWLRPLAMMIAGVGMGLTITATTIAVQDEMPWSTRGIATSMLQFSRTIGGMTTVTLLSVLVTGRFVRGLGPRRQSLPEPSALLDPGQWTALDPAAITLARRSLRAALVLGFGTIGALGLLTLLLHLAFPALKMARASPGTERGGPERD